jgi:restriction system protein
MARQKNSTFEDMIVGASKLPWWAGLLLALVSFVVLHAIASSPVGTIAGPGQMGNFVLKNIMRTFALFGQFVIPGGFCIGALVSGIKGIRQRKLYDKVASSPGVATLNNMRWEDFERLVSEYYRRKGFQVKREGGNGPDGGIDLVLNRGNETYLVQCKQWKAYKVGVQPVREFYGVIASRGVAGGYFVTSGEFTTDAFRFASGLNLELIDGSELREMIDVAQKKPEQQYDSNDVRQVSVAPACPKCGADMRKRIANIGAQAGKEFWGCSTFPNCKGTRPVEVSVKSAGVQAAVSQDSAASSLPEKKNCPDCGSEMILRQFKSGPKNGQQFYGCDPCKKGWPANLIGQN